MLTVTAEKEDPSPLQKHFAGTYFTLRLGLGVIAVAFPFLLAVGGRVYAGLPLQSSMSAYYHAPAGEGAMRTWFVGVLFALGALLYLYRGFSDRENIVLNVAGVATVLVAVFPMEWGCGQSCARFSVHGTSAILAFVCIAYVAVFCGKETVKLIRDPGRRRRYLRTYSALGALMLASPLAAFVLTSLLRRQGSLVFFLEASGMIAFAAYWLVKSRELRETEADTFALEGALESSAV